MPEKALPPLEAVKIHGLDEIRVGQTAVYKAAPKPIEAVEAYTFLWEVRDEEGKLISKGEGIDFRFTPERPGTHSVTLKAVNAAGETVKEETLIVAVAEETGTKAEAESSPPQEQGESPPPPTQQDTSSSEPRGTLVEGFVTTSLTPPTGFSFDLLAAGDIDGDGKADLVLGSTELTTVVLYQGLGNGRFLEAGSLSLELIPERLIVADFNSNAYADIFAVNWSLNKAVLLLANKGFRFSPPRPLWVPEGAWDVLADQLNDNPGAELVWLTRDGAVVWSFTIFGNVLEWAHPPRELSFVMVVSSPYVRADLDGDGITEIAFYNPNPGEIELLDGGQPPITLTVTPGRLPLLDLAVADIDGDGDLDLLGLSTTGSVYTWKLRGER